MRKLEHFIRATLILIFVLYLSFLSLSNASFMQSFYKDTIINLVQKHLHTKLKLGSVSIRIFDQITLNEICLYDQHNQPLITGKRFLLKLNLLDLLQGKTTIETISLLNTSINLYTPLNSKQTNFQFILNALSSNDTTTQTPPLRIESFVLHKAKLSYHNNNYLDSLQSVFNPSHLNLSDIQLNLSLKKLTKDSLHLRVRKLSFTHKSFQLKHLQTLFISGKNQTTLTKFKLKLPQSALTFDTLLLAHSKPLFTSNNLFQKVQLLGNHCTITPSDFKYFIPSLASLSQTFYLHTNLKADAQTISLQPLYLVNTQNTFFLKANTFIHNWQQTNPTLKGSLIQSKINPSFLNQVYKAFTTKELPSFLLRIGSLYTTGTYAINSQKASIKSEIQSNLGLLHLQGELNHKENLSFQAFSNKFNLQTFNPSFSSFAFHLDGKANLSIQSATLQFRIPFASLLQYTYQNLQGTIEYSPSKTLLAFQIKDPNLAINLQGNLAHLNKPQQEITLDANLSYFNPVALKLSTPYPKTTFSTLLSAHILGNTWSSLSGKITLSNTAFKTPAKTLYFKPFILQSTTKDNLRIIHLQSEPLRAYVKGFFAYSDLLPSFYNLIGRHIPYFNFVNRPAKNTQLSFNVSLYPSVWTTPLLPFSFTDSLNIQGVLHDKSQTFHLAAITPQLQINTYQIQNFSLFTKNHNTHISTLLQGNYKDEASTSPFALNIQGKNNKINASLLWQNNDTKAPTKIEAQIDFVTNKKKIQEAHISLFPTTFFAKGTQWELEPAFLTISKQGSNITHFVLKNDTQKIAVNGLYGSNPNDTLTVTLQRINLGKTLHLVDFNAVEFDGTINGKAYITSPQKQLQAMANLNIDSFAFNRAVFGNLNAKVNLNSHQKQIELKANIAKQNTQTTVTGFIAPVRKELDLMIKANNTPVAFLNPFLEGIFQDMKGTCQGYTRLFGSFSHLDLEGKQVVNATTKCVPLQTTYSLMQDTLIMQPGEFLFKNFHFSDLQSGKGKASGRVTHQGFSNFTYNFNLEVENMQCLNLAKTASSPFYASLWGTGKVRISGDPSTTQIDGQLTPQQNCIFTYIDRQSESSNTQSILFRDGSKQQKDTALLLPAPFFDIKSNLFLNLQIETNPALTLNVILNEETGENIMLQGTGMLNILYHNKGKVDVFGTYLISKGNYQLNLEQIVKKDFKFATGSTITFKGEPFEGDLNLKATYLLPSVSLRDLQNDESFKNKHTKVDCILKIQGKVDNPQINFDIDFPSLSPTEQQILKNRLSNDEDRNKQAIYLLSLGRFYPLDISQQQTANSQNPSQLNVTTNALLSSTLSSQLNSLIDKTLNFKNLSFSTNIATQYERWNETEIGGQVSGNFFNNRLIFNGSMGYKEDIRNTNNNFVGDFSLRYLITPKGGISMKVYSETNNKYFTKSSLNTQGVGLIFSTSFYHFPFFKSKKKPIQKQK